MFRALSVFVAVLVLVTGKLEGSSGSTDILGVHINTILLGVLIGAALLTGFAVDSIIAYLRWSPVGFGYYKLKSPGRLEWP